MRFLRLRPALSACGLALALLAGCGGGGGSAPATDSTTAAATLSGTAATGAALAGALISITDINGAAACSNGNPITADSSGVYTCTLNASATAPFVIVARDPVGVVAPLVSLLQTAPAAGSSTIANITPLTHAVAAMLTSSKNPLDLIPADASDASAKAARKAALQAAASNLAAQIKTLVAQLQQVLLEAGVTDAANFDPFKTPIVARSTAGGTQSASDLLLDIVKVETGASAGGTTTIYISSRKRDDAPIEIGVAGTTPTATLAQSTGTSTFTPAELDVVKTKLESCFAKPASTRVTGTTTIVEGGVSIYSLVSVDAACQGFTVDYAGLAGVSFKQRGMSANTWFYGMMTAATMDGAKFNLPEVLRYSAAADGKDEAVVNFRYRDKDGFPGNTILVAKKFPGSDVSSGRKAGSDWWLYGNQLPVSVFVQPILRKTVQLAPGAGSGTGTFGNLAESSYRTGLFFNIGRFTPNSVGLQYARVKGPGLPSSGIVYAVPSTGVCGNDTVGDLHILNATGSVPSEGSPTASQVFVSSTDFFYLQRAKLDGSAYANPTNSAIYSSTTVNISAIPAFSKYTVELFYAGEGTARYTVKVSTAAPVLPAAAGAAQQWQSLDSATLKYLDPSDPLAAAQSSMTLAWDNNPYAELVRNVGVYSGSRTSTSFGFTEVKKTVTAVTKGASSVVVSAPTGSGCADGSQYKALSADALSYRTLQLRYVKTDGSYKDSTASYD